MRYIFATIALLGFLLMSFYIATKVSPDAVSMAVGMLFGVLAGVPTALMANASGRRDYDERYIEKIERRYPNGELAAFGIAPQPKVFVISKEDVIHIPNNQQAYLPYSREA